MRELSAEARLHFHARSVSSRTERRLHTLAIYGSLALIAVYLRIQAQRIGLRPADRPDADPADAAGEVGYFPTSSIWPLVMAIGAVVLANAFVFGVWLAIVGGVLFLIAVVGYATQARA